MSIDPIVRRLGETPRRRKVWYAIAVVGVLAVVIFALNAVYGFVGGASSSTGTQRTVTVSRGTVQSSVTASGNVSVARSAEANFSTSGTVTSVHVKVGDYVQVGQKLATLDSASAEANLETAKANLAQAEATLASSQGGATAEQQASNASSLHSAQVQVTTAEQQLEADKKALATAQQQLADSKKLDCPPTSSSSSASSSSSPSSSGSSGTSSQASSQTTNSGAASSASPSSFSGSSSTSSGSSTGPSSGSGTNPANGGTSSSASSGSASSGSAASGSAPSGSGSSGSGSSGSASAGSGTSAAGSGGVGSTPSSTTGSSDAAAGGGGGGTTPTQTTTNGRALIYAALVAPTVTTGQASGITAGSATLAGSLNPGGLATTYSFQYGTSPSNLSFSTPSLDAGSGSGPVPVTTTVSGLSPSQNYWFRLVATNSSGTTDGDLGLFMTTAAAPVTPGPSTTATTGQASSVTSTGATLNGTVTPAGQDTSYYFQYGPSPTDLGSSTPTGGAGSGSTAVPVTAAVTGLTPGQSYWFRLVATNSSGTVNGALAVFTSVATPTSATTGQASSILASTATLNGSVNPGGVDTSVHFEYGTSSTSLTSSTPAVDVGSGSSTTPVTAALKGLKPSQNYWFRVVATNSSGTTNGALALFTTGESTLATTGQASPVGSTSATLNGTVSPGGLDTSYYFEYGTSATSLGSKTPKSDAGSGSSTIPVTAALKGLKPSQNYWFRLVATNSSGTTQGALGLFTTGQATLATTGQASPVASTSATLNGTVSPGGLDTSYYFEYGTSATSLGSKTPKADAGSGSTDVPVSSALSGLKADTTYYFRLVATNSAATSQGGIASLTTAPASVSATTGQATTVGSTTAEVTGTVNPGGLTTSYWFEYGTSSFAAATAKASAGSGTGSVSVTAKLTGLKTNTAYLFRLVASNSSGSSTGTQSSFTTSTAAAPTASTGSASGVLTTSMTLTGSVNPNSSATSYWFEYGTTSSYGSTTAPVDGGSASTESQVSALVSGLKANTTYLFRLVAKNAFGTTVGVGQTVTTQTSSCTQYAQTVADDEQTVANQEAAVQTAELNLAQVQASIDASNTPSSATIAQDEASVKQAQATVAADEKALAATVLTAPITGTVTAVNGAVGSTVSAGASTVSVAGQSSSSASSSASSSPTGGGGSTSSSSSGFVTIDSLHQLVVVAGFAEADAADLSVGQPATLTFPALTNTQVAGKVVAVSNSSTVVNNVVTYDATIALINPPADVKQGMTTNVSVVTATRSNVLVLPTAAITTNGSISTVQLLQNGETTVTRVTTGLVGNSTTEVVSGLRRGDVVVEPTVTITASSSSTTGGGPFGGGGGGFGGGGVGFPGG